MEKTAKPAVAVHRRDATGHLDPEYAADLLAHSGESAQAKGDEAFRSSALRHDSLAEELGESFLRTATGGEDDDVATLEQVIAEESGGPFVETTGATEYAHDTDASNPRGATREPFPRTSSR